MSGRFAVLAFAAGWAAVCRLPERVGMVTFRLAADCVWRRPGPGTRRLAANLRRVVGPQVPEPEFQALLRVALRSYARYWLEVFRLPVLPPERIRSMQVGDRARLDEAMAAGRGVILALPHQGNWDLAGAWAVLEGMPFTTVVERLEPTRLFDRFVAYRERLGMEVLALTGGGRSPLDVLGERLRAGGLVCLVADRDLSARGVEVCFFGGRTRMPAGPALLAIRTGAVLLPVSLWFDGAGWAALIGERIVPPADGSLDARIVSTTQAMADAFAAGIAEHPADWHMLQRMWLDRDRGGGR